MRPIPTSVPSTSRARTEARDARKPATPPARVDPRPTDVGAEGGVLLRARRCGDDLHEVGHVSAGLYRDEVDQRVEVGRRGEAAVERHYVARGYRLVTRNWRCRIGELDLVLTRGGTLVICEVKTRRGSRFGGGFEAVDARKRQKLRALGEPFRRPPPIGPSSIRFAVASVRLRVDGSAAVEIFDDAF